MQCNWKKEGKDLIKKTFKKNRRTIKSATKSAKRGNL